MRGCSSLEQPKDAAVMAAVYIEQSNKFIGRQMACFYDLHQLRTGVVDRTEKLYISPER